MTSPARRLVDAATHTDVLVRAPGRANLIGEHTDADEGYVLPVALDLATVVSGRRAADRLVLRSLDLPADGVVEVDLRTGQGPTVGWGRYVTAVVGVLRDSGLALHGVDGVVASDVPLGAGLSSSAALEVAIALALLVEPIAPARLARLCQRAENAGVGVQSGIMDQFASAGAQAGSALFLDCRSLHTEQVPVPADLLVLVVDSAVSRSLTSSAYNERRQQCALAARGLGVRVLRDATLELLDDRWGSLDDVIRRRARHVVTENARVLTAVRALRDDDRATLRATFAASQDSLAHDFEVSVPELDLLVQLAGDTAGVVASRMTGAGFGGCTVSLVERNHAEAARDALVAAYVWATGLAARSWLCTPSAGASVLGAA